MSALDFDMGSYQKLSIVIAILPHIHCGGVRKEQIVSHNVRLGCRVSSLAKRMKDDAAPPWRLKPHIIPLDCNRMWLVYGDPVLHSVTEFLETNLCVCCKILAENFI
nr:hypothetical protein Iba_chr14aCG16380 [Ipomoea batatas]